MNINSYKFKGCFLKAIVSRPPFLEDLVKSINVTAGR
jgi:hypothetical protein